MHEDIKRNGWFTWKKRTRDKVNKILYFIQGRPVLRLRNTTLESALHPIRTDCAGHFSSVGAFGPYGFLGNMRASQQGC